MHSHVAPRKQAGSAAAWPGARRPLSRPAVACPPSPAPPRGGNSPPGHVEGVWLQAQECGVRGGEGGRSAPAGISTRSLCWPGMRSTSAVARPRGGWRRRSSTRQPQPKQQDRGAHLRCRTRPAKRTGSGFCTCGVGRRVWGEQGAQVGPPHQQRSALECRASAAAAAAASPGSQRPCASRLTTGTWCH